MDIASGLAAAAAALSTVKQIAELDKALSQGELKLKMASLYSDLADVRMALSDAKERVADLEGQMKTAADWSADSANYRLTSIQNDVKVMRYVGDESSQPPHDLCPHCFVKGRKSFLQPEYRLARRTEHLKCNECGADLQTRGMA
ncbi:MAG: hypothetical protein EON87_00980 [Brevundimonas sp.]|nr:MAG: hypothetical protein EON87_00980 [Brevundimonas sp.]